MLCFLAKALTNLFVSSGESPRHFIFGPQDFIKSAIHWQRVAP
jgi:hypothetical protein